MYGCDPLVVESEMVPVQLRAVVPRRASIGFALLKVSACASTNMCLEHTMNL
jgi:hypothetical protein